ncbi:2-dehydro-3-deoxy-D-gluconate 5-dehydrogenase KduD [Echinimonas agarilytica]|uniref:2-dehydro-3-deoxy-D-gluconate 5-dehydrogenase n=1 Tax=Echinimonas agarilytica TaxID=1215918 RepID=A0AA41W8V4_9GAMM|nr:2-dehydro-3-deoxy-D-gluconate 5-dehydrogenase KduD [Echinimonas agarilytica]
MTNNQFELTGKVAVVTGCGGGLGQGMALALANAGCDIVGVTTSSPDDTMEKVTQAGRQFISVQADLTYTKDIPSIIEQAVDKLGQMDILVNNAGIIRRNAAIEFSEQDWDDVMDINLRTAFFLSQAVARQFIRQGSGGKIINIASMLSFQGGIHVPSYTASKSGIAGITRAMANEWAHHGINVNAIAPGYMATKNTQALRSDDQRNQAILDRIPAGRWGTPDDLAGPCVFLSSQASNYINGYTIAVDGGWLAR